MFGLGFSEILLILVIALIVFGPKRLPEVAKTLGRTVGGFKRSLDELHRDFNLNTPHPDEDKKLPQGERSLTATTPLAEKQLELPAGSPEKQT